MRHLMKKALIPAAIVLIAAAAHADVTQPTWKYVVYDKDADVIIFVDITNVQRRGDVASAWFKDYRGKHVDRLLTHDKKYWAAVQAHDDDAERRILESLTGNGDLEGRTTLVEANCASNTLKVLGTVNNGKFVEAPGTLKRVIPGGLEAAMETAVCTAMPVATQAPR
jgi:hypothetical protein